MEGHVCVAGENPSLNVQAPSSAAQRYVHLHSSAIFNNCASVVDQKFTASKGRNNNIIKEGSYQLFNL